MSTIRETNDSVFMSIELACWFALALCPVLYWVNGPAVSTDQFVVRTVFCCLVVIAALSLRIYNWRHRRVSAAMASND